MTDNDKLKYISYLSLKGELDHVQGHGTHLYLEGRRTDPDCIASICVFNEKTDYMRDYVADRTGNVNSLSFDPVRSK